VVIEQRAFPRAHPGGGSGIPALGRDGARGRLPPPKKLKYKYNEEKIKLIV